MLPEYEPDRLEKIIRFVCGAFAGLIVGGFIALRLDLSDSMILLAAAGGTLLCGFLALAWGDSFWGLLSGMFRWW
jgi:hypothetical protein